MSLSSQLLPTEANADLSCEYGWPESEYFVSEKHHLVYCPIPKVACSSLKLWWAELLKGESESFITAKGNGVPFIEHDRLNQCFQLRQHSRRLGRRPLTEDGWFRFAFVRNPWSRLVSAFLNKFLSPQDVAQPVFQAVHRRWKSDPWLTARQVVLQALLPFSTSRHSRTTISPLISGTKAWRDELTFRHFIDFLTTQDLEDGEIDAHWRPQYRFLGGVAFQFIGRFECLDESLRSISNMLGIKSSLPMVNATKYARRGELSTLNFANVPLSQLRRLPSMPDYRKFYTPDLAKQTRSLFCRDVEQFGYEFEA